MQLEVLGFREHQRRGEQPSHRVKPRGLLATWPIIGCLLSILLVGCGVTLESSAPRPPETQAPTIALGEIDGSYYDGDTDDLLTAGLGLAGLRSVAPAYRDPLHPTANELRRHAIHTNFNSLIPLGDQSGYARLFGPKPGTEKIAGYEYLTTVNHTDGTPAATLMVQIPDNWNRQTPCIVAAPSSGSRGIYGAIGTAGQWGLRRGCIVAYTDKGTGTGFHLLDPDLSYSIQGELINGDSNGSLFRTQATTDVRRFAKSNPHRLASRHAHSGHNVEKDWGRFVLYSIQLAFYLTNTYHLDENMLPLVRDNTTVLAASISNGGNSVLRAAEQDTAGWIDAVVAAEPNISLPQGLKLTIEDERGPVISYARQLLDTGTFMNLYQPCAAVAYSQDPDAIFAEQLKALLPALVQRCDALYRDGLIQSDNLAAQVREAQQAIDLWGVLPDAYDLGAVSVFIQLWEGISVNYTNSYGRFGVADNVCGISYAAVDSQGKPTALTVETRAALFASSTGIPPTMGIQLVNDRADNGPIELSRSRNKTGKFDLAFDAARCFRQKWRNPRVQQGIAQVTFNGNLQGKPAIIVHGRSDNLINVNHSSRPYYALNKTRYPHQSQLRYYEVTNAQHFDSLLRFPDIAKRFIPLHNYFEQALDLMWRHLQQGTPLPDSQVVRTRPAATATTALTRLNLPPIAVDPGRDTIVFEKGVMAIP